MLHYKDHKEEKKKKTTCKSHLDQHALYIIWLPLSACMDLFIIFNIIGLFLAQWGNQTTRVFSYNTCWVNIMVCFVQWLPLHSFLITILMSHIVPSEQATGLSPLKRAARLAAFSYYSCGEKQSPYCNPISITSVSACCGWNSSKH